MTWFDVLLVIVFTASVLMALDSVLVLVLGVVVLVLGVGLFDGKEPEE